MANLSGGTRVYRNETIRLADPSIDGQILDVQFEDCILLGPAVLAFLGRASLMESCTFEAATLESMFYRITGPHLTGAIPAAGAAFVRCTFRGVGFAGLAAEMDALRARIESTLAT